MSTDYNIPINPAEAVPYGPHAAGGYAPAEVVPSERIFVPHIDDTKGTYMVVGGHNGPNAQSAAFEAASKVTETFQNGIVVATETNAKDEMKSAIAWAEEHKVPTTVVQLFSTPEGQPACVVGNIGKGQVSVLRGDKLVPLTINHSKNGSSDPQEAARDQAAVDNAMSSAGLTERQRRLFTERGSHLPGIEDGRNIKAHVGVSRLKPGDKIIVTNPGIRANLTQIQQREILLRANGSESGATGLATGARAVAQSNPASPRADYGEKYAIVIDALPAINHAPMSPAIQPQSKQLAAQNGGQSASAVSAYYSGLDKTQVRPAIIASVPAVQKLPNAVANLSLTPEQARNAETATMVDLGYEDEVFQMGYRRPEETDLERFRPGTYEPQQWNRIDMTNLIGSETSDEGIKRRGKRDEDSVGSNEYKNAQGVVGSLFILADGMGGHSPGRGADASKIAVDTIFSEMPNLLSDQQYATYEDKLEEAIKRGNGAIAAYNKENHVDSGTTIVAVWVRQDNSFFVMHVGDSRAILSDAINKKAYSLTKDHSLVRDLVEAGLLTPEKARTDPRRNQLSRALHGTAVNIETTQSKSGEKLDRTKKLLLCCDGLHGVVGDEDQPEDAPELHALLWSSDDPHIVNRRLISAAMANKAPDNVSSIVVQTK